MIFRLFTAATILYTSILLRTNIYPLINSLPGMTPPSGIFGLNNNFTHFVEERVKSDLRLCPIPLFPTFFKTNKNDRLTNSERETILQMIFILQ
jgi:hypothetical protein